MFWVEGPGTLNSEPRTSSYELLTLLEVKAIILAVTKNKDCIARPKLPTKPHTTFNLRKVTLYVSECGAKWCRGHSGNSR
jgi:hypothetical protein